MQVSILQSAVQEAIALSVHVDMCMGVAAV